MEEFLNFVLWAAFWWVVIKAFEGFLTIRKIKKDSDQLRTELEEQLEIVLHNVKEENHNDIHYWFDDDNDQFLAQGKTMDEVRAHLKARFKDHIFIVKDQFVLVGPDYIGVDVGKDDPEAAGKYVAKVLVERAGLQIIDK